MTSQPKLFNFCLVTKAVCGGIGEVSCTSNCFRVMRLSTPRNTALN